MKTVIFDEQAEGFVSEELASGAVGFEGPLAERLRLLQLGAPFSFLSGEPSLPYHWRWSCPETAGSDDFLTDAVTRWLGQADDRQRMLILEEHMRRRSDPRPTRFELYLDERVYFAVSATTSSDVPDALNWVYGYPGIGVLTRIDSTFSSARDLDAADLDVVARGAVAVLVRAWDDEAFLIAPVLGQFHPDTLTL